MIRAFTFKQNLLDKVYYNINTNKNLIQLNEYV